MDSCSGSDESKSVSDEIENENGKRLEDEFTLALQCQSDEEDGRDRDHVDVDVDEDTLGPLSEADLLTQIECLKAKMAHPEMFVSGYDVDDQGIEEPEDPNTPGERFLRASEEGKLMVVKELLSAYPYVVEYKDRDGYTAVHRAAYSEHPEVIRHLVENSGVGLALGLVQKVTEDGWTPLHCACHWNSHKCVKQLVEYGVNVNAQTNGGQTPLHLASNEQAREAMILLLKSPGIDVTLQNAIGETSLDIAKRAGRHSNLFDMSQDALKNL